MLTKKIPHAIGDFFKLIVGKPLEDQPDFLDWAMCYRQYFKIVQSQFSAEGVTANVAG